jgi:hypothetical protein
MTRTAVATDAFSSTLSANWTQINSGYAPIATSSGKVQGSGLIGFTLGASAYWSADTFSDDQYASIVLSGVSNHSSFDYSGGVICRASTGTGASRDFYAVGLALSYSGGNPYTRLFRVNNSGLTDLVSLATIPWVDGNILSLEVTGTGATVTITVYKDSGSGPVALTGFTSIADSSVDRLLTGRPGVHFTGTGNPAGDDFEAGNITSAPTITDAGDESYYNDETGITITGTNFGASETGSAAVIISPTNNVADGAAVTQDATSWSATSITFTAVRGALDWFTPMYLFVKDSGGTSNATGYPVEFHDPSAWRAIFTRRHTFVNEIIIQY